MIRIAREISWLRKPLRVRPRVYSRALLLCKVGQFLNLSFQGRISPKPSGERFGERPEMHYFVDELGRVLSVAYLALRRFGWRCLQLNQSRIGQSAYLLRH